MERKGRVWCDPEGTYILPEDLVLEEGHHCIVDLFGNERWVRPEDVATYRVAREEASEHAARGAWDEIQAKAAPAMAALAALFRENDAGPLGDMQDALGTKDAAPGSEAAIKGAF
jgi:hypothetical protein